MFHHWEPALHIFSIAFSEDRVPANEL